MQARVSGRTCEAWVAAMRRLVPGVGRRAARIRRRGGDGIGGHGIARRRRAVRRLAEVVRVAAGLT